MSETIGSISIHETEITIKYDIGHSKKFKTKDFPKYQVGTQWIDYHGIRFFLVEEE